jgi:ubiquinone/menaquinone biosynthesis C-methylase UbiE
LSHPYEYHNFILREISRTSSPSMVLDAGCGTGIWGYLLRASRRESVTLFGLDIFRDYLSFVKHRNIYDGLLQADLSHLPFRDGTFEYVIAVEVLEHLPKSLGRKMVNELLRCCHKKVVLTTPNGFRHQEVKGLPTETHLSGWTTGELRALGFKVHGIGNKFVPFNEKRITLWALAYYITTPIAHVFAQVGEHLIAVKSVPPLPTIGLATNSASSQRESD